MTKKDTKKDQKKVKVKDLETKKDPKGGPIYMYGVGGGGAG